MAGDVKPPGSPRNYPSGLTPPPLALRPQHEGFYAVLANGEIADPAEVGAMVASLQSLMPLTSPEEARLHLSQNRWSLQETFKVATVQSRLTSCTPDKARLLLSQNRWDLEDTVKALFPDEAEDKTATHEGTDGKGWYQCPVGWVIGTLIFQDSRG